MVAKNRLIVALPLALAIVGAGACTSLGRLGHGKPAAVEPPLAGFDSITIADGLTADIAVGEAFAIVIDGDKELVRQVDARVEKQTLVLRNTDPRAQDARTAKHPLRVRVVLPKLRRLQVSGSRVAVRAVAAPTLQIVARDGSTVNATALEGGRLVLEATNGSRIVLAGAVDTLEFALSGASRGDARALKVRTAKVSLAGASRLDLRPERAVSGEATGASKLAVWSTPKRVGVATHGASTVSYVR